MFLALTCGKGEEKNGTAVCVGDSVLLKSIAMANQSPPSTSESDNTPHSSRKVSGAPEDDCFLRLGEQKARPFKSSRPGLYPDLYDVTLHSKAAVFGLTCPQLNPQRRQVVPGAHLRLSHRRAGYLHAKEEQSKGKD